MNDDYDDDYDDDHNDDDDGDDGGGDDDDHDDNANHDHDDDDGVSSDDHDDHDQYHDDDDDDGDGDGMVILLCREGVDIDICLSLILVSSRFILYNSWSPTQTYALTCVPCWNDKIQYCMFSSVDANPWNNNGYQWPRILHMRPSGCGWYYAETHLLCMCNKL